MAINLAKQLAAAMKKSGKPIGVQAMTLTQKTPGTRTPGALGAGTNPTSTSYSCSGFVEAYVREYAEGATVRRTDVKISILGATLSVIPRPGDTVAVSSGPFAGTYHVTPRGLGDGVAAVYVLQCRK